MAPLRFSLVIFFSWTAACTQGLKINLPHSSTPSTQSISYKSRARFSTSLQLAPDIHATSTIEPIEIKVANTRSYEEHVSNLQEFGLPERSYVHLAKQNDAPHLNVAQNTPSKLLAVDDETSLATEGGKWFFVAYVAFSIVAGLKELVVRFQKWRENNSE